MAIDACFKIPNQEAYQEETKLIYAKKISTLTSEKCQPGNNRTWEFEQLKSAD